MNLCPKRAISECRRKSWLISTRRCQHTCSTTSTTTILSRMLPIFQSFPDPWSISVVAIWAEAWFSRQKAREICNPQLKSWKKWHLKRSLLTKWPCTNRQVLFRERLGNLISGRVARDPRCPCPITLKQMHRRYSTVPTLTRRNNIKPTNHHLLQLHTRSPASSISTNRMSMKSKVEGSK